MNAARTQKIAEVLKNVKTQGQALKQPGVGAPAINAAVKEGVSRVPTTLPGAGWVAIVMYAIAALLAIGLVLLAVDHWVTPIFQRKTGGPGYIPIPGNDISQVFWLKLADVANVPINAPPAPAPANGAPTPPPVVSASVIEGQASWSMSCDVWLDDEFPQELPDVMPQRRFLLLGQNINTPKLVLAFDNTKNTLYVYSYSANGSTMESAYVDNVPIRKPFRIGIVKNPKTLEVYFNGRLVRTRQLRAATALPSAGDSFFAPSSLIYESKTVSKGIKVLNLRVFGYPVLPDEFAGRMDDLKGAKDFRNY